jgi:hypothetical protein
MTTATMSERCWDRVQMPVVVVSELVLLHHSEHLIPIPQKSRVLVARGWTHMVCRSRVCEEALSHCDFLH